MKTPRLSNSVAPPSQTKPCLACSKPFVPNFRPDLMRGSNLFCRACLDSCKKKDGRP